MIPKKPKKPKQVKLSTLQAKADAAMSVYVRMKHSDDNGYIKCVSCGNPYHWKDVDCGHFIPKSRGAAVRWVFENCAPECRGCNRFSESHLIGYTLYMLDTFGRDKITELEQMARKPLSPSQKRMLAEEAYQHYTEVVKSL